MGMYDTVWVNCPQCNEEIDFQSKSGDCSLEYYTLDGCPNDVLQDVNRHAPIICENCQTKVMVDIPNRKAVIVH